MDPKAVLDQLFVDVSFPGIDIKKCRACGKEIVLRSGSQATTRLFSHAVVAHGYKPEQVVLGPVSVPKK